MLSAYKLTQANQNNDIGVVELSMADNTILSDIKVDTSLLATPGQIEVTNAEYELFKSILNNARSVNLDPMFKFKVATNILVAAKFSKLANINGFETKPELTFSNSKNSSAVQLGKPYKLYGSGLRTHTVIPVTYDASSD